ncbi:hypothetical protein ACF1AJ_17585 [Leifsonia sp. NPDC014704]|uniref:hypothetical protein n=1 Tax=Leifsonia sp. NPDC014704 TaxID=3364123 RepID=UPI0036F47F1B
MERQPPEPKPWGASDDEAIELCREWMIYLGATDAVAAYGTTAEVCDIYSAGSLAWVDNQRGNLAVHRVERAASVSAADGRQALIFVRAGVFPAARVRADDLGVAIFGFDPEGGTLDGVNLLGRELLAGGIGG